MLPSYSPAGLGKAKRDGYAHHFARRMVKEPSSEPGGAGPGRSSKRHHSTFGGPVGSRLTMTGRVRRLEIRFGSTAAVPSVDEEIFERLAAGDWQSALKLLEPRE